eukprot:657087-Rhodomonas_salina.2
MALPVDVRGADASERQLRDDLVTSYWPTRLLRGARVLLAYALRGTTIASGLRARYAVSGTEIAYAGDVASCRT